MLSWFIILIWFSVIDCQQDFFIIKKYKQDGPPDYFCITNNSYALSWVDDANNQRLMQESIFIPELSEQQWNFQYGGEMSEFWILENSTNGHINEIILDRRWEGLAVKRTKLLRDDSNTTLLFIPALSKIKRDNFIIPFSIRAEKEAHIFLCDGADVTNSNCYWLLLQAFGGDITALRKCKAGNIFSENNKLPHQPCNELLVKKRHTEFSKNLTNKAWLHFKVEITKNRLILSQIKSSKSEEILSYDDHDGSTIKISHMVIHSKKPTLWKIHNLEYMYTNQKMEQVKFGPLINVTENSVCVSMFVSMCESCRITLNLGKKENPHDILKEKTYDYEKSGWAEIDFIVDNIKNKQVILLVTTNSVNQDNGFWAVSGITQCQKNKFRRIGLTEPLKCQLLSEEGSVISADDDTISDAQLASSCSEDAVSSFCIPCSWMFSESCGELKICEKQGATTTKCSCSAGYLPDGSGCSICNGDTFGHGCQNKCGRCYNNYCNKINGECSPCRDNYSGPRCDIRSYKLYTFTSSDGITPNTSSQTNVDLIILLSLLLSLLLIVAIAVAAFLKSQLIVTKYNSIENCMRGADKTEVPEEEIPLQATIVNKTKVYSKRIKIANLEEYVKQSISNEELERQHKLFSCSQTKPWECGVLPANKPKNRYTNIIAYDHTRVILAKINGKENSDYINANYINGYKIPRAYIATQGPKMSTVYDFWRMIWQERVQYIVMLANVYEGGTKKLEKYWPDINENMLYGDFTIQHISSHVYADYQHRVFILTVKNEMRQINQYHFFSWPDHGVPLYSQSLVPFLKTILKIPLSSQSPVLVHCSAGVGRTGTILLCDICLRMAAKEGAVDILQTLQELNDQRPNMVDSIYQYKLAHLVILECVIREPTSIPCDKIEDVVQNFLETGEISKQMRYLDNTEWQDQSMKSVVQKSNTMVVFEEKNRFATIVPELQGCVFLKRYPSDDDKSTYINAVTVDGFQSPRRFIVTQQPMANTLGDFWRLVQEKEVSVILSLNEINSKEKSSCNFWPSSKEQEMVPVDFITLKHTDTLFLKHYDLITIQMYHKAEEGHKTVEIMSMKNWPAKRSCPNKTENFLTFWEDSSGISRKSDPVIVTCFDGAKASGLYVAMSFIIEKIKLEQICDVCQAVQTVRHNRSQFVRGEEQFCFLYKAAVDYISGFQSYANFS